MATLKPLISVIVPTKNAEKTIERTYKSLTQQTYENFEVLNIDISTDSTPDITRNYSLMDKRFKLINSPVMGLAKQRNFGVRKAQGELIVFIDGDDAVTPTFLETLYNAKFQSNADIACCNFLHIDSITNEQLDRINSNSSRILNNIETCLQLETKRNTQLTLCQGKLISKIFLLHNIVNEDVLNEDEATTYSWYIKANKVVVLDIQDYLYYITPNSLSSIHNKKLEQKIPPLCESYQYRYNLYKKLNNKRLSFLGWKRLVDFSLQYAYVFKKQNQDDLKNKLANYYKNNFRFSYFLIHPFTALKLFAKYLRCK